MGENANKKDGEQISFRLETALKRLFDSRIGAEGRTAKETITDLIRGYVEYGLAEVVPRTPPGVVQNTPIRVQAVYKSEEAGGVESTQELHRLADRAAAVLSTERVAAILRASAGLEREANEAPRERSSPAAPKGDIAKRVRKALGIKPSSRGAAPGVREAS